MSLKVKLTIDPVAPPAVPKTATKENRRIQVALEIIESSSHLSPESPFPISATPSSAGVSSESEIDTPISSPEKSPKFSVLKERESLKGKLQISYQKAINRGHGFSNLAKLRLEAFKDKEESPKKDISIKEIVPEVIEMTPTLNYDDYLADLPTWDESVKNKSASFQTREDFDFLRSLPIDFGDFQNFIGADLGKLELEHLQGSPLGILLSKNGFNIVDSLNTDGANSYCFSIQKEGSFDVHFLKVMKPKKWDVPSLRNSIYSEERGTGWLMKNKDGLTGVLVPDLVIGVDKRGKLTQHCEEGNLILATVSPMINGKNLTRLFKDRSIKQGDIPNIVTNMLKAVDSFKQKQMNHTDLNPGNFLLDLDTSIVTVIDFDEGTINASKLMQGREGGGVYNAPENGLKMDEFTLGLVLLEMCTQLKPSDVLVTGQQKTVKNHILEGDIPLSAIPSGLRELSPVIEGLLQVDPDKRWSVREALERWLKIIF